MFQNWEGSLPCHLHMSSVRKTRWELKILFCLQRPTDLNLCSKYISEGPIAQTGAPYAKVPGIRVYGMLCLVNGKKKRRKSKMLWGEAGEKNPTFPPVPQHLWNMIEE